MDKKDRNTKPGDSEIVTRKGFLMAPLKKSEKKHSETVEFKKATDINSQNQNTDGKKSDKKSRHQKDRRRHNDKKAKDRENINATHTHEKVEKPEKKDAPHHNHEKGRGKFKNKPNYDNHHNDKNKNRHQEKHEKINRQEESGPEKENKNKAKDMPKRNPSILGDLGFISDAFSKRKKPALRDIDEEKEEKIDYSKAIPLRDQIYPPKKEKPVLTEQDKEGKIEIIGIRFKEAGKIYYFDPNNTQISFGTPVIVETARGLEYGYTAISNRYIPCESIVAPLKKIIRIATKEDKERLDANKALEAQASGVFNEKVAKLGLEMTLVGVEYTFDNTKLLFYFAAENRIDFRELVKELASVFRTRIELRQVGVRDEAKMIGGLGVCGRPLC